MSKQQILNIIRAVLADLQFVNKKMDECRDWCKGKDFMTYTTISTWTIKNKDCYYQLERIENALLEELGLDKWSKRGPIPHQREEDTKSTTPA